MKFGIVSNPFRTAPPKLAIAVLRARTLHCIAVLCAFALCTIFPARAADNDVIKLVFNPNIYNSLPLMLAIDRGYFTDEHLDVQVTKSTQSAGAIIPLLARGDVDISPTVVTPAFFNQFTAGFGIKLLASMDESHKGWNDSLYLMVRQDVWDAKPSFGLADLRGKSLPNPPGSPAAFLIYSALAKAGLSKTDVNMTRQLSGPTDLLPSIRNKLFDVLAVQEPLVTVIEKQGLAHRWLGYQDLIPYYQSGYVAASAAFAQSHRDALVRFMVAYLRACRDVNASGGKWTPEFIDTVAKWSGQPRDVIAAIPGPAYPGSGTVNADSVSRQQQMWIAQKMLTTSIPVAQTIDASVLNAAIKQLGKK